MVTTYELYAGFLPYLALCNMNTALGLEVNGNPRALRSKFHQCRISKSRSQFSVNSEAVANLGSDIEARGSDMMLMDFGEFYFITVDLPQPHLLILVTIILSRMSRWNNRPFSVCRAKASREADWYTKMKQEMGFDIVRVHLIRVLIFFAFALPRGSFI